MTDIQKAAHLVSNSSVNSHKVNTFLVSVTQINKQNTTCSLEVILVVSSCLCFLQTKRIHFRVFEHCGFLLLGFDL